MYIIACKNIWSLPPVWLDFTSNNQEKCIWYHMVGYNAIGLVKSAKAVRIFHEEILFITFFSCENLLGAFLQL